MKSAFIIAYKPIDYSILLGYIYKHTLYRDKYKIQAGRQGGKKMVGEKKFTSEPEPLPHTTTSKLRHCPTTTDQNIQNTPCGTVAILVLYLLKVLLSLFPEPPEMHGVLRVGHDPGHRAQRHPAKAQPSHKQPQHPHPRPHQSTGGGHCPLHHLEPAERASAGVVARNGEGGAGAVESQRVDEEDGHYGEDHEVL